MDYKPSCNTKVNEENSKMNKYFSIGEAAKAVHTTSETLRHYDRIGLVKPSKKTNGQIIAIMMKIVWGD